MICPYCGNKAVWVSNAVVYGEPLGKSHMIYYCSDCGAYVGCHNNTRKPLGTMANAELRKLRIRAHNHIDKLYKNGGITRKELYKGLKLYFGKEVHVGESNKEMCMELINLELIKIKLLLFSSGVKIGMV